MCVCVCVCVLVLVLVLMRVCVNACVRACVGVIFSIKKRREGSKTSRDRHSSPYILRNMFKETGYKRERRGGGGLKERTITMNISAEVLTAC